MAHRPCATTGIPGGGFATPLIPGEKNATPGQNVGPGTSVPVTLEGGDFSARAGQSVLASFSFSRSNTLAGGLASYQFTLNGVPQDQVFLASGVGPDTVSGVAVLQIPADGPRTIGVRVTSTTGVETILSGSLVVLGSKPIT